MFKSFQTKLVVVFVSLIASVQLITFLAVYNATTRNVETQIRDQLIYSGGTFKRHLEEQVQKLSQSTAILVSDYAFRKVIATGDKATIQSAIYNHGARIKADRVILITTENKIIMDTGRSIQPGELEALEQLIHIADAYNQADTMLVLDNTLYEFVVVPVLAPIPIAWIGIGIKLDNKVASNLKSLFPLNLDISFAQKNGKQNWNILASTLDNNLHHELIKNISGLTNQTSGIPINSSLENLLKIRPPTNMNLGGKDYVTIALPIGSQGRDSKVIALLQYPLATAMIAYLPLLYWVKILAALGLLCTFMGGILIGRSVTKPVRTLVDAALRIEQGNYQQPVYLAQKDELGRLADTFNLMMEGISDREEKIRYQANYDSLTGLPNRQEFSRIVQMNIEKTNNIFYVILVSIERLHEINTTLSHAVGDHLIRQISERLQPALKESDVLARFSNNTFILLVTKDKADDENSVSIAKSIHEIFDQTFSIEDINVDVQVQIGMSHFPQHSKDGNILIQKADVAAYTALQAGEPVAVYDPKKDNYSSDRLSLMSELKKGLLCDEFELYFQPKIDIIKGRVTHAEALIRWNHPTKGFMFPDEFIPLAEQTGNIKKVTIWALEESIRQCSIWKQSGIDINVSVNLSVKDLLNGDLPERIPKLLHKYKIGPENIVLEITESTIMKNPEVALAVLGMLRDIGLKISIDDFGTGYSSMEYLKKLPAHILKIDKSFVMELAKNTEDRVIVHSMIQLAHNLGLKVVAEGVEDEESLKILTENGCDYAQGYYLCRPIPVSKFNEWLANSEWGLTNISAPSAITKL